MFWLSNNSSVKFTRSCVSTASPDQSWYASDATVQVRWVLSNMFSKLHVTCARSHKLGHTNCWAILCEDGDGYSIFSNPQSPEEHTNFHRIICFIDTEEGSLQTDSSHDFIHNTYRKVLLMYTYNTLVVLVTYTYTHAHKLNIDLSICVISSLVPRPVQFFKWALVWG